MAKKRSMTGWYDPILLLETGIRVAISTVFGQFADKREALAAANAIADDPFDETFDYSQRDEGGDFWFDYVADTGDGWDSTFAVANLLAQDVLKPDDKTPLPRGRLLVMGGDQVYPTASPEEYADRLIAPFKEAYEPDGKARWDADARPDLYALPGNHDWYDGLSTFFHLFCRRTIKEAGHAGVDREGTVIGGRQTRQTRSYFAIKLRNDWWLWGTDSQLEGYIDQPQVDYFQHVASQWMAPNSKVILCMGEPNWAYVDEKKPGRPFITLSYLTRLAGMVAGKNHRMMLVLSGDSHHYARFLEKELNYIICGGGGAFLHPTHHLRRKTCFKFDYPPPGEPAVAGQSYDRSFSIATQQGSEEEALYPSRWTSWWLTWGNFLFAILNWKFTLLLVPAYFLFNWMLDFNARVWGGADHSLAKAVAHGDLWEAMGAYCQLTVVSPWPAVLAAAALGGYRYFAKVENDWGRFLMGFLHFLVQAAAIIMLTCLVLRWIGPSSSIAWSMFVASVAAAIGSATVLGGYLWFSLAVLKLHWNEAFSSLRITWFKSFLRLRIDKQGVLTIYPIGLRCPSGKPHLIEPPIRIS